MALVLEANKSDIDVPQPSIHNSLCAAQLQYAYLFDGIFGCGGSRTVLPRKHDKRAGGEKQNAITLNTSHLVASHIDKLIVIIRWMVIGGRWIYKLQFIA